LADPPIRIVSESDAEIARRRAREAIA